MRKLPKITNIKTLVETKHFRIEAVDLHFSNAVEVTYERFYTPGQGAVLVVAMLDMDTVLLIREYAGGVHRYELYCPKGKIENNEDILAAANREIKEEIGYGAKKLELLIAMTAGPGYSNHTTHVVLATDLYPESLPGDEPEKLEIVPWKLSELDELLQQDDMTEARSIAALYIARDKLKQ